MKNSNLKKTRFTVCVFLFLISCNSKKQHREESILYYKSTDLDNNTFSYAIRKYEHNNDTIIQKYILLNKKGQIFFKSKDRYIRRKDSLFVLSNIKNDNSEYFFFSTNSKKDSCNTVQMLLDSYKVCYKGDNRDNLHELYIETLSYHPEQNIFLLDKNYHIISKNDIVNNTKEEVIKDAKVIDSIKDKLNQASKKVMWW